jgi:hypothetical protein
MKTTYDGTWLIMPHGRIECFLLVEWLAKFGTTLGKMQMVMCETESYEESNAVKIYFEFGREKDYKNLADYINLNS